MDDLLEFDDEQWKTVVRNLKNPASTMSVGQPKSPPVPIRGIRFAIGEISVGNPGRESNASWAIARGAHKNPTYAQMVKASNRVVLEVRKEVSNRVVSEVSILSSTGNHSHTRKTST